MCGIIGVSSPNDINESDVRLSFLLADSRGGHSTGFTDGKKIVRSVDDSEGFLRRATEGDKISLPKSFNQFIGHTRYATEGDKSLVNAHPFNFDTALGVHNGTIDNFKELNKKYGDQCLDHIKKKYPDKEYIQEIDEIQSDSLLLYYMIHELGFEKAVKQTQGTMGLVYFDQDKRIHVYRYDKPLCYGFKNGELWFGSLKRYLKSLGCSQIKPFTQHSHFIINDGNIVESQQLKNESAPKDKKAHRTEDLDPGFTKKKQMVGRPKNKTKTKTKTKTRSKSSNKNKVVKNKKKKKDRTFAFKAPMNAKGAFVDGKEELILWWFSEENPDVVYVEVEDSDGILTYDLDSQKERGVFKYDFPEIKDDVLDEHMMLETIYELREDKSQKVYA